MSGGRAESMKLVRALRKQGFTVERTGSGHWRASNDAGEHTVFAFSPRKAGLSKTLKRLEAMGFKK